MHKKIRKPEFAIIGDGGWGTTLGILLAAKGLSVTIWGAFADNVAYMNRKRENKRFLPGKYIPEEILITADLKTAVKNKDVIILAIPSQYLREVLIKIKNAGYPKDAIYLSVIKGIETATLKRISEVIHDELPKVKIAVLSGPTIACEVAQGIPTVAVIASGDKQIRKFLQDIFTTQRFRVYTNKDTIGVEIAGSLKNVIALACGVSDGLGFGTNTKAAILSRGLAEITRLGLAMKAKAQTFSGISGLGDLVTTCISTHSRNRFVGEELGKGRKLKDITGHMQMVAEGIPTAKAGYFLSLKYKVDMPITKEVYNVLYKKKPALKAFKDLMSRQKKEE